MGPEDWALFVARWLKNTHEIAVDEFSLGYDIMQAFEEYDKLNPPENQ